MKRFFLLLTFCFFASSANAQSSGVGIRLGLPYLAFTYSHDFEAAWQGFGIRVSLGTFVVPTFGGSNNLPVALTLEGLYRLQLPSSKSNVYAGIGVGGGVVTGNPVYLTALAYLHLGIELALFAEIYFNIDVQPVLWLYYVNQSRLLIAPFFSLGLGYRF
jgi:hypothetical protein